MCTFHTFALLILISLLGISGCFPTLDLWARLSPGKGTICLVLNYMCTCVKKRRGQRERERGGSQESSNMQRGWGEELKRMIKGSCSFHLHLGTSDCCSHVISLQSYSFGNYGVLISTQTARSLFYCEQLFIAR